MLIVCYCFYYLCGAWRASTGPARGAGQPATILGEGRNRSQHLSSNTSVKSRFKNINLVNKILLPSAWVSLMVLWARCENFRFEVVNSAASRLRDKLAFWILLFVLVFSVKLL